MSMQIDNVVKTIIPIANGVSRNLGQQNPTPFNFAIHGGAVRDAMIATVHYMPVPKISDIDIITSYKVSNLESNPNVKMYLYNSFGGRKIWFNYNTCIDVFSETRANLREFVNEPALNCYQILYLYPEHEVVMTSEFTKFMETKIVSVSNKNPYKQGPGGLNMQALIVANKLSQRFNREFKIDNNIVKEIKNMSATQTDEILDYVNHKINKGELFKDILQDIKRIKSL